MQLISTLLRQKYKLHLTLFLNRRNSATRLSAQRNKLGNGNIARSERDLTKVTKVRVRPNSITKDDLGPSNIINTVPTNTVLKPRPKMKTTTMITNDSSLPANHAAGEKKHMPAIFPAQLGNLLFNIYTLQIPSLPN